MSTKSAPDHVLEALNHAPEDDELSTAEESAAADAARRDLLVGEGYTTDELRRILEADGRSPTDRSGP